MSYNAVETSRESGEPINLYKFVTGSGPNDYLAYTDAEEDMTVAGVTYKAVPIQRGEITARSKNEKATLDIRMSRITEIGLLFTVYPPSYVIGLIIYQGHVGDADQEYLAIWSGRLINVGFEDQEVVLSCELTSISLQRPGLRANFQLGCRHVLYGKRCKAAKIARILTVMSIASGNTIIARYSTPLGQPLQKFKAGMLEWITLSGRREIRNIFAVSAIAGSDISLTISGLTNEVTVGGQVSMFLGCAHNMDDCQNVFANILNYGGQPWIPTKNPHGIGTPFL